MTFTLDRSTGAVVVAPLAFPDADTPEVRLGTPTVALWCTILDAQSTLDTSDLDEVARLSVGVLRRLRHPGPADPSLWPLWVCDPTLVAGLLVHWRDWPVSAFTGATADSGRPDRHPHLSPGRRCQIDLYQACRPYVTPDQVDRMTMWQVAAMLIDAEAEDRPSSPDVEVGRFHRREEYVDKAGVRHVRSVKWTRNPDAPLRYSGRLQAMPDPVRSHPDAVQHPEHPTRLRPEIL